MTVAPLLTADGFYAGPQPTLRGDGLVLRPWWPSDAGIVAEAFADPAISFWHLHALAESQAHGWVAERIRRWPARAGVDWAIVPDGSPHQVLGRIAIHRVALGQGLGEVAYWVLPRARGAHVAARGLELLCGWAFGPQRMHRLELAHSVDNPASCAVARRAGFALEGIKRAELRHADGWHDMHLHARLADDPPPPGEPG